MYAAVLWIVFQSDIAALGSASYAERQAAEARLSLWVDVAWPALNRPFSDCEQRRRARRVLASAIPQGVPPIALLAGNPTPEWQRAQTCHSVIGTRPGPDWQLAWLRPDQRSSLRWVVRYYGERSRTQSLYRDWHSDADGREATRLLVNDLLTLGVPPPVIRGLLNRMEQAEQRLADTPIRYYLR
jgi:hypothetical protein